MGTPRDAEERRYPEPAVGGILRAVPSERRAALQIHPIQQVLRRLCPQNESHHASGAQARRDHAGGLGGPDGGAGGHRHRGAAGRLPVCSGAAIQRLRLHGGLSGHEAGGLDYRSCQRLPVFRRGHSHPHAGQSQDRCGQELPDGNGAQ